MEYDTRMKKNRYMQKCASLVDIMPSENVRNKESILHDSMNKNLKT
jgi:hypothetical protein